MKKILCFLFVFIMIFSNLLYTTTNAAVGDVVGNAVHTDIVAYINHYAVPSYAANGKSCIVAEDLRNFGFDVIWDGTARTLSIYRNSNFYPTEMTVEKTIQSGTFFSSILETDIVVYANNQRITSYALNGYTMIPIEELTMFGAVYWVPEERAIKLWIDGFNQRTTQQQPLVAMYAPDGDMITVCKSEVSAYKNLGWYETQSEALADNETVNNSSTSSNPSADGNYYRTPAGKKYHLDPNCGGKNSYKTTNISGLSPCSKCAK